MSSNVIKSEDIDVKFQNLYIDIYFFYKLSLKVYYASTRNIIYLSIYIHNISELGQNMFSMKTLRTSLYKIWRQNLITN